MYKAGSPGSGERVGARRGKNGSGWNLRGGFSLLLFPPTSLLESQMDDGAIGHVIVGQ